MTVYVSGLLHIKRFLNGKDWKHHLNKICTAIIIFCLQFVSKSIYPDPQVSLCCTSGAVETGLEILVHSSHYMPVILVH